MCYGNDADSTSCSMKRGSVCSSPRGPDAKVVASLTLYDSRRLRLPAALEHRRSELCTKSSIVMMRAQTLFMTAWRVNLGAA